MLRARAARARARVELARHEELRQLWKEVAQLRGDVDELAEPEPEPTPDPPPPDPIGDRIRRTLVLVKPAPENDREP